MPGSLLSFGRRAKRTGQANGALEPEGLAPSRTAPPSLRGHAAPEASPLRQQTLEDPASSRKSSQAASTASSHETYTNSPAHEVDTSVKSPVRLGFRLESGPLIMYGLPTESAGALLAGVLDLEVVQAEPTRLLSAEMSIVQKSTVRARFATKNSPPRPARTKIETLAKWNVLEHKQEYLGGAIYGYPFSHLLPGSLPPTSSNGVFAIEYFLEATAVPADTPDKPVRQRLDLRVGRSLAHIREKNSVRVFPPTELTITLEVPTGVFQNGQLAAELRMEGIITESEDDAEDPENAGHLVQRFKRWRPRRVNWRFEEIIKVKPVRPATPDGEEPPSPTEDDEEPIEQKVTLGTGEIKSGWKIDLSHKGLVQLVSPDLIQQALSRASKDVHDSVLGFTLDHVLHLEMIVAEEAASTRTGTSSVITGNARVLRMQFKLPVIDRPGLGITWEDEVPPMYADVPLSPPTYDSSPLSTPFMEELHNMTFSPAHSPAIAPVPSPTLRHIDPTVQGPEPSQRPLFGSAAEALAAKFKKRMMQVQQDDVDPNSLRPSRSSHR